MALSHAGKPYTVCAFLPGSWVYQQLEELSQPKLGLLACSGVSLKISHISAPPDGLVPRAPPYKTSGIRYNS
jgi:hypothetical protein